MNRDTHTSKPRHRIRSLLLLSIFIIFTVWQWPNINNNFAKSKHALVTYVAEIDALGKKSHALMAEVVATKSAAEDRLHQLETQLLESQNLQTAIDASQKITSDDLNPDLLEEVEQLITLANQHLSVTGNVQAALTNLERAEILLRQTENSQLSSLHSGLIKDIKKLATASDVRAMTMQTSLHLSDLAAKVDALPLLMDADLTAIEIDLVPKQMPDESKLWRKFLSEIWADLKTFIHVQKVSNPETQLLSPSQAHFLRENLKLKFILMRLSLLSHDKADFEANLKSTINWINQYYDQNSETVIAMLRALAQIQNDNIGFEMPDASASLDALHNFRNKHNEENK